MRSRGCWDRAPTWSATSRYVPAPTDPEMRALPKVLWPPTWPIEPLPGHARLSAYFNLDNGSGRIRGIYTQGNVAVGPIFERWLEPFHDLGADTVTYRDTGSTDHVAFAAVGLPGFQFVQDMLDYGTRTHHSNLDHLRPRGRGRPEAGLGGAGVVPLSRGDARPAAAARAAAAGRRPRRRPRRSTRSRRRAATRAPRTSSRSIDPRPCATHDRRRPTPAATRASGRARRE